MIFLLLDHEDYNNAKKKVYIFAIIIHKSFIFFIFLLIIIFLLNIKFLVIFIFYICNIFYNNFIIVYYNHFIILIENNISISLEKSSTFFRNLIFVLILIYFIIIKCPLKTPI